MKGCVLAIDGFGVGTRQPFKWEVKRPKDYRFRKGGFALVVLAGCDVNAKFIAASYFFIGDEAFTNTDQFVSPWPGKNFVLYYF